MYADDISRGNHFYCTARANYQIGEYVASSCHAMKYELFSTVVVVVM